MYYLYKNKNEKIYNKKMIIKKYKNMKNITR